MKLIYVFERRHAYLYDDKMFGMSYFRDYGFEIETWSLVNWTFSNLDFPDKGSKASNIFYISSLKDMKDNLQRVNNDDCYFIFYPYHAYGLISYQARRCVKKSGYLFSNLTESPTFEHLIHGDGNKSVFLSEIKGLLKIGVYWVYGYVFGDQKRREQFKNQTAAKFGWLVARSHFNFVTTEIMYETMPSALEKFSTRNILLHSESYEEYLESNKKDNSPVVQDDYIVYIDQFLPGHSDFKKHGKKPIIQDKITYYQEMNELFNRLEEYYKCEVVIAAHPKAEYQKNEFNGRKVIFFETDKLVKNSKLVVFQYSTAFGLICLYKKDYLNIYSNEMFRNDPNIKRTYEIISSTCGSRALDISEEKEMSVWNEYVHAYSPESFRTYKKLLLISEKSQFFKESMFKIIADIIAEGCKR